MSKENELRPSFIRGDCQTCGVQHEPGGDIALHAAGRGRFDASPSEEMFWPTVLMVS